MSDLRTTRSDPSLVPPIEKLRRILRDQAPFHTVYQFRDPRQVGVFEQKPNHALNQALESLDCECLSQSSTLSAQSTPAEPKLVV